MKNIGLVLFTFLVVTTLNAQDKLEKEQLNDLTRTFTIEEGKLTGEGAEFLIAEMSKAQFTMIAEYHGSKRISEFTNAIIPVLDNVGYKNMVVEVGPISGKFLNSKKQNLHETLKNINKKYSHFDGEDTYVPIPFFGNVEDADFLANAKNRNWDIIGIDQEFFFGYPFLIDQLYANLNADEKKNHETLYKQVVDSLASFYAKDDAGEGKLGILLKESPVIKDFYGQMSKKKNNIEIIEALEASTHIYWLYATKQWYENNSVRVNYMKEQLRKQLAAKDFDLSKDKLLIKMGGYHLAKGFSPLSIYEVGNTLNEFASFNGNTALNISFSNRFYTEDGKVLDILDATKDYLTRLKDLDQMGKKDEWVVIDLRPLIKGHFYGPVKYKFNKHIEDRVKRYDLLIIPKTEVDPTRNN